MVDNKGIMDATNEIRRNLGKKGRNFEYHRQTTPPAHWRQRERGTGGRQEDRGRQTDRPTDHPSVRHIDIERQGVRARERRKHVTSKQRLMSTPVALALQLLLLASVSAHPNGAPAKSCANLFPEHSHTQPQTTTSPYVLELNQSFYAPSQVISVKLTSTDGRQPFMGYQLRASRLRGDTEEAVGAFLPSPDPYAMYRLQHWYPSHGQNNCVTHIDSDIKLTESVLWKAPARSLSDVVFRAGVVKNYEVFWVNVESSVLTADIPSADTTFFPEISDTVAPINLDEDCEKTKGCFLYPASCKNAKDCDYLVTYSHLASSSALRFEMMGKAEGYLSVAFSQDNKMGDDETITCVAKDNITSIQLGYNEGFINERHRITNITDIGVKRQGGVIHCSFVRPLVMTIHHIDEVTGTTQPRTFDLSDNYYLFLAWGDVFQGTDTPMKHVELPLVSLHAINFTQFGMIGASSVPLMVQIHGMFSILAWMTLAGFSMIVARHFRADLRRPFLGIPLWFQLHRYVMFVVAALTSIAIIIIFVSVGRWSESATLHAVFGLVVAALSLIQIGGSYMRPAETSRRLIFNWVHRCTGILTYILAAVTVVLGVNSSMFMPALRQRLTLVVAVWLAVLACWEFFLELVRWYGWCMLPKDTSGTQSGDMKVEEPKSRKDDFPRKNFLLILYCVSNMILLLLSIAFLYTA
ncbi:Ferric-chelate reductase 1 [Lamellibrachia satsuma]|nr:Ferric-chelate reductase 1 [Lamellibrachia satsuma]